METAFSTCHKHHRRCKSLEDWDELLDFQSPTHLQKQNVSRVESRAGPCYSLQQLPGLFFFPAGLSKSLQRYLEFQSLHSYCRPPFRTNVDQLPVSQTKSTSHPSPKLSWATLGYHYNWTDRSYDPNDISTMPIELQAVARHFATAVMRNTTSKPPSDPPTFQASACIVNYYTTKSAMGGHRDDVEQALDKPVVSISLGQRPAVFVVGGSTLDSTPVIPMVLRPGDVVVLDGESRLCYHSMARLLPCDIPNNLDRNTGASANDGDLGLSLEDITGLKLPGVDMDEKHTKELLAYLKDRRININLRQVYPDDSLVQD